MRIMGSACAAVGRLIYGDVLGWVGVNYGHWINDPHLGTFLWPPTINLRT